ncbi:MAG: MATE family efflux transporter [Pseudomonadota bacterium]
MSTQTTNLEPHSRLAEAKRLWVIALPLMGAQLAQMGMGVVDAIMAGQYSSVDLAGVALGGSVFWPVMMLMMGLVQAVTPTVAQLNGAGRYGEIGEVIRQGLWLAVIGGTVAVIMLNNIGAIYTLAQVDPAAAEISVPYLRMCSMGVPALMCFFCLRFLSDGMSYTRPALLISIAALCLKVPLNYVLIYGKLGMPEMGGVGAGLAQAFVMWLQLILIVIIVCGKRFDVTGWRARFSWPQWRRIVPLLRIGIPIGATIFAEMALFSVTTILLGHLGAATVASHNIAMNINGVLFMPALALGMAGTIRIGFRVGAGEIREARTSAAINISSTVVIALLGSVLIYLLRFDMVGLYTSEADVAGLSATLLLFVVFFLVFDATQSTCVGTLRGYKDTSVPMWIALFSYWVVGLPLECVLGFGLLGEPMGVYGFWIGLAVGVGTAAILLSIRLWMISKDYDFIRDRAELGG